VSTPYNITSQFTYTERSSLRAHLLTETANITRHFERVWKRKQDGKRRKMGTNV